MICTKSEIDQWYASELMITFYPMVTMCNNNQFMLKIILILQTFKHFKENIGFILSIMYNVLRAILLAKKCIFIFVFILIKKKRFQPKYFKKKVLKIYLKKKNIKFPFGFNVQYLLSCLIYKSLKSTTREFILIF